MTSHKFNHYKKIKEKDISTSIYFPCMSHNYIISEAKRKGYLLMVENDSHLYDKWHNYCYKKKIPVSIIRRNKGFAEIEIDLIYTKHKINSIGNDKLFEMFKLFVSRGKIHKTGRCITGHYISLDKVSINEAEEVYSEAMQLYNNYHQSD